MLGDKNKSIILSYKNLRRLIGILGISLPFVCILGGLIFAQLTVQASISFYYHTNMRDILVGLLIGVSMFLLTYKGFLKLDNLITTISGLSGLGVAIFPCKIDKISADLLGIFQLTPDASQILHFSCAVIFFLLLAVNSIFLFTRTKSKDIPMTDEKKKRNIIYIICGIIIIACLIALLIIMILMDDYEVKRLRLIFIFETIMLVVFGISWLVKGETLFKDKRAIG
jgi:hypothetical protein